MNTYLFDFDGTLVDSMPSYISVMLRILEENNIEYGSDIVKIITPLGNAGTAKYYTEIGCPLSYDEIIKVMNGYMIKEYSENVPAKDSVIETLNKMKSRGDSLNVLTASSHRTLDPCLKRLGIFDVFDNVWSCDDFNTGKTNPEIYRAAAKRLCKETKDIIFVDDNLGADKAAKKAGMTVFGIYDESSREYVDETKKATDAYVYSFAEILNL